MKSLAVVSLKGGVGKTTLAIHFAFYIHERLKQSVVLLDGDPISSSIRWRRRGPGFPFKVVSLDDDPGEPEWLVLDTEAHPEPSDIELLAKQVDRLVLPVSNIESLETAIEIQSLLGETSRIAVVNMAPPFPQKDGQEMRIALADAGVPVASTLIRRAKAYEVAKLEGTSSYHATSRLGRAVWFEFDAVAREVMNYAS